MTRASPWSMPQLTEQVLFRPGRCHIASLLLALPLIVMGGAQSSRAGETHEGPTVVAAAEASGRRGAEAPGGCRFANRIYPPGATISCSADPNIGKACALGLPFAKWTCAKGRWAPSGAHR